MESTKNRRKIIIINKPFQHKFIINFLLITAVSLLITGIIFALYYYFKYQFGTSIFNNYVCSIKVGEMIKVYSLFSIITPAIIIVVTVLILLLSILIFVFGRTYSHRIAGPIYRIKKTIEAICNRDFSFTVKLREKDKLQEIAGYLNGLIDFLNSQITFIRGHNNEITNKLIELKKKLSGNRDVQFLMEDIDKISLELQDYLDKIKLKK